MLHFVRVQLFAILASHIYRFTSWDDFFTREFQPGIHPIADPNDNKVIVNACESAPYAIARNVKKCDKFWIKSQPYNLKFVIKQSHM